MSETKISILFDKSNFKKILTAHKKFSLQGKTAEKTPLSNIQFTVYNDTLTLFSTNGFHALRTVINLMSNNGDNGKFYLPASLCAKLSFPKGKLNEINIETNENGIVEFYDNEFSLSQTLTSYNCIDYPTLPNFKNEEIADKILTFQSIKNLSSLLAQDEDLKVYFDKSDTGNVQIKALSSEITQDVLIAPIITTDLP